MPRVTNRRITSISLAIEWTRWVRDSYITWICLEVYCISCTRNTYVGCIELDSTSTYLLSNSTRKSKGCQSTYNSRKWITVTYYTRLTINWWTTVGCTIDTESDWSRLCWHDSSTEGVCCIVEECTIATLREICPLREV